MEIEKLDEVNRKFDELLELTIKQDELQLSIPALNEGLSVALSAINNANGIIGEISKWKGDIVPIVEHGYFKEKVRALSSNLEAMEHNYRLIKKYPEEEKIILRGIRFNPKTNKLEKMEEVI